MTTAVRALVALAWLLLAGAAAAHKPSDSYLGLDLRGARIDAQWDIALRDLDHAIGLDANGDGDITWGELRARHAEIASYALARLSVQADGQTCTATVGQQLVDDHTDGAYTVLRFTLQCPAAPLRLTLRYGLFADLDPLHRGLLRLSGPGGTRTAVLDPKAGPASFELKAPDRIAQFLDFGREGVWHIWVGLDHILFLLSLLLPAVLVRQGGGWLPVERQRSALLDVAKIVTAFTLAHSITLTLATLGVVSLPTALVESTIAASVVLAALNNLAPLFRGRRWVAAFGFGLVHGFGFASVLAGLGLPQDALLAALVAFNLGVEVGQLAIVAVFLPLAFSLRATPFYRRVVLQLGSWVIAAVAAVWFVERAFSVRILNL